MDFLTNVVYILRCRKNIPVKQHRDTIMPSVAFELFLSDEVQSLLDDFAALLDVRVTFFSLSGEFLRRGKDSTANFLFQTDRTVLRKRIIVEIARQTHSAGYGYPAAGNRSIRKKSDRMVFEKFKTVTHRRFPLRAAGTAPSGRGWHPGLWRRLHTLRWRYVMQAVFPEWKVCS